MTIPKTISKISSSEIYADNLVLLNDLRLYPKEPNRDVLDRLISEKLKSLKGYDSKEESLSKAQA